MRSRERRTKRAFAMYGLLGRHRARSAHCVFCRSCGCRLGVVGCTGAGKTTLLNLPMRFYDPTAGEVLLDGTDIRKFRIADVRRQFAVVLQEPVLFAASIPENIAYGKPDATDLEIMAAKAASSHDFISRLPGGYATQIGERGKRLSRAASVNESHWHGHSCATVPS
jgi:ABC-type multidrug transport system fused ATPase/permease subunit